MKKIKKRFKEVKILLDKLWQNMYNIKELLKYAVFSKVKSNKDKEK